MTTFFANLDGWDITYIALGSWLLFAAMVAPSVGRMARHDDEIRQPADRNWLCSDGYFRTEAEAADWTEAHDGAWTRRVADDETWLPEWINDHDEPLYVPQEWVS